MPALDILALDTATPQVRVPSASDTYRLPRVVLGVNGSASAPSFAAVGNAGTGIYFPFGVDIGMSRAGNQFFSFGGVTSTFTGQLSLCSVIGAADGVFIARDAANTLALRNGTAAQAFNVYNTFTDASNYERGFFRYVGNVLEIGHESAGTGSNRVMNIRANANVNITSAVGAVGIVTSTGTRWVFTSDGNFGANVDNTNDIGAASSARPRDIYIGRNFEQSGYHQFAEISDPAAGAANTGRLYTRDNGSGKTQLCVRFATGAVQVIATEP